MSVHGGYRLSQIASHTIKQLLALGSSRDRVDVKLPKVFRGRPYLPGVAEFLDFVAIHDLAPVRDFALLRTRNPIAMSPVPINPIEACSGTTTPVVPLPSEIGPPV